jgi:erythromycin esterase
MKKQIMLMLTLGISLISMGQKPLTYFQLLTIQPNDSYSDLEHLDSLFTSAKVIGVGESTHGSSEFTVFRHRMFKYLVEKKGFTIFFLEADVSACKRVNRYINGAEDDGKEALLEIKLWPWLTQEMLDLVNWMKEHNKTAEKKVQFVGCDMQLIVDDKLELGRIISDTNKVNAVFSGMKYPYKDSAQVIHAYQRWNELKAECKVNQTTQIDTLIDISIEQWFQHKLTNGITYNFRDSCMAANIMHYLDAYPDAKGMYFAHNGHVAKAIYDYKIGHPRKMAGYHLSEKLGTGYICIGQTTELGTFNALTYGKQGYEFRLHELKNAKKKTLENYLTSFKEPILFCSLEELYGIEKCSYTEIGALYGKSLEGYKVKRNRTFNPSRYDYFIFIKNTSETNLLKRPKITGQHND